MNKHQAQGMVSDINRVIEFIEMNYTSINVDLEEFIVSWHIMASLTIIPPLLAILLSAKEDLVSHILNWAEQDSEEIDSIEEPCNHEKLVGNLAKIMIQNIYRSGVSW